VGWETSSGSGSWSGSGSEDDGEDADGHGENGDHDHAMDGTSDEGAGRGEQQKVGYAVEGVDKVVEEDNPVEHQKALDGEGDVAMDGAEEYKDEHLGKGKEVEGQHQAEGSSTTATTGSGSGSTSTAEPSSSSIHTAASTTS
jgi:hypothetical protein